MTTTWPGWSDENTLVLPVDDAPPSAPLSIGGHELVPKDELHITLVGPRLGTELRGALGERLEAATRPAFEALDWSFQRGGARVLIEKPTRDASGKPRTVASVIERVELPALDFYYRWLAELLGRELAVPPPHITLYKLAGGRGIGIPSERSLRAWSRPGVAIA